MSNDSYIDEDRCDDQELAEMEAEYHYWKISQDALPAHKQEGYAERMYERADELRQLAKEMMQ